MSGGCAIHTSYDGLEVTRHAPCVASCATTPGLGDDDLVKRAVNAARGPGRGYNPRWVSVMHAFGLGSAYARRLCVRFGLDPDERVR